MTDKSLPHVVLTTIGYGGFRSAEEGIKRSKMRHRLGAGWLGHVSSRVEVTYLHNTVSSDVKSGLTIEHHVENG